jgi:hypothetical protein
MTMSRSIRFFIVFFQDLAGLRHSLMCDVSHSVDAEKGKSRSKRYLPGARKSHAHDVT